MSGPRVRAVGLAVPPYAVRQEDIKAFAAYLFHEKFDHLERLLPVFDNACIAKRHLAQPLPWYAAEHSFAEANFLYEENALELAAAASAQALDRAGVTPADIGLVVFVSSTGITTPTIDAMLIQRLGISPNAARLPVWGLGCAGGVAGLARAAELTAAVPGRVALLVAAELCSLTFQRNDFSKSNLVGAGIFADGAAAAVIAAGGAGPEILTSHSTLFANTEDIMGWDVIATGLKVRFSRDIPAFVRQYLPSLVDGACAEWGLARQAITHYVVHPGGAKVLDAYAESLGLPAGALAGAHEVLADYGNMSSASVLFVLERFLRATPPADGYGVMLALGPGFSAEQVLFRW
jgi:alkylresorcinol/alkylpyrone synthase